MAARPMQSLTHLLRSCQIDTKTLCVMQHISICEAKLFSNKCQKSESSNEWTDGDTEMNSFSHFGTKQTRWLTLCSLWTTSNKVC